MGKFRKKPAEVDARQWNGSAASTRDVLKWIDRQGTAARTRWTDGVGEELLVATAIGIQQAKPGDWVVMDARQEFRVYEDEAFHALFEPVARKVTRIDADPGEDADMLALGDILAAANARYTDEQLAAERRLQAVYGPGTFIVPEELHQRLQSSFPLATPLMVTTTPKDPDTFAVTDMLSRYGGTVGPAIEAEYGEPVDHIAYGDGSTD